MQQLLSRAKSGDRRAEQELFARLLPRFLYLARRRIADQHAAEDVAQDACLKVLELYRDQEFAVSFEAWAWGVLQMQIRNHFHRTSLERWRHADGDVAPEPAAVATDPDLEYDLLRCLRKIGTAQPRYAQILRLAYEGHSAESIGRTLGVTTNHLYVILHRARAQLRSCLEAAP